MHPLSTVLIVTTEPGDAQRTPVLACIDALKTTSVTVEVCEVNNVNDLDKVLEQLAHSTGTSLICAGNDGQVRSVIRRLAWKNHIPGSRRAQYSAPADRTLLDLPPIGILPILPQQWNNSPDLVLDLPLALGLPVEPHRVAETVLAQKTHRLDLIRTNQGFATIHASVIGTLTPYQQHVPWRAHIEVDDVTLVNYDDIVVAAAVANCGRRTRLAGLELTPQAHVDDGLLDVAVVVGKPFRLARKNRSYSRLEIRRFQGRAASITTDKDVPVAVVDDGVEGTLISRRNWWVEKSAWAVYANDHGDAQLTALSPFNGMAK